MRLLFLFLLFFSCHSTHQKNHPFYLGGVAVNEENLQEWIDSFKWVGMNTVEVTVYAKQWLWFTDDLEEDEEAKGVIQEIKAAKKAGLKVVMILRVQLQHWFPSNHFKWHGMILPISHGALRSWWKKYQAYCFKWAKICEEENVDILVLGSEMNALASTFPIQKFPHLYQYYNDLAAQQAHEGRVSKYQNELENKALFPQATLAQYVQRKIEEQHHWGQLATFADCDNPIQLANDRREFILQEWINLIKKTRTVFSGKLSYAANFDNYQEVNFWQHLDFIGINAYFPLRKVNHKPLQESTTKREFRKNWTKILADICTFQEQNRLEDKAVLFTELGYTTYLDCTVESWAGSGFSLTGEGDREQLIIWKEQKKFPQERIWAVETLHEAVEKTNFPLHGILYWKLTTHDYLLAEEPFALHFHQTSMDSLQDALLLFLED